MTRRRGTRGSIVVGPLVGAAIGLAVLAGLTVALAQAARWVVRANARAETHDTADLVTQAFLFDLRSAGWDPAATSGARLVHAAPAELELHADLDGDGTIDATSAERVRWRLAPASGTISRVLGDQSMPLASIAASASFAYRDATGTTLPASGTGLAASDLGRVRTVDLTFALAPPGGGAAVERVATVALRGGAS